MSDQFLETVNANPILSERLRTASETVFAFARENYGVTLDQADIGGLSAVKVAVYSNQALDVGDEWFLAEISKIRAIAGREFLQTDAPKGAADKKDALEYGEKLAVDRDYRNQTVARLTELRASPERYKPAAAFDPNELSDAEKRRFVQSISGPDAARRRLEWGYKLGLIGARK